MSSADNPQKPQGDSSLILDNPQKLQGEVKQNEAKDTAEEAPLFAEPEPLGEPHHGPTTAVRVWAAGHVAKVSFKYHDVGYTTPLQDGAVVIVGTELAHLQLETEGCEKAEFDVCQLSNETFIFSPDANLTPCRVETSAHVEVGPPAEDLCEPAVAALRTWDCTTVLKDEEAETLYVDLPDLASWRAFVELVGDVDPNVLFLPNPALPLVQRRALANAFRHYGGLYSREVSRNQAVAIPAHYAPGGAALPAAIMYAYRSVAVLDRLMYRFQLVAGAGPAVFPVIAGLAIGTFLGTITVLYANGHTVTIRLYR